jgi:hypothetical protein
MENKLIKADALLSTLRDDKSINGANLRRVIQHINAAPAVDERFSKLRKKVMQAIEEQLAIDCSCKSYEGTFEWNICYPDYFEDETGNKGASFYMLTLHCYVLGPGRHYQWKGKTMDETLDKAEKDIYRWLGGNEDA